MNVKQFSDTKTQDFYHCIVLSPFKEKFGIRVIHFGLNDLNYRNSDEKGNIGRLCSQSEVNCILLSSIFVKIFLYLIKIMLGQVSKITR